MSTKDCPLIINLRFVRYIRYPVKNKMVNILVKLVVV